MEGSVEPPYGFIDVEGVDKLREHPVTAAILVMIC